MENVIFCCNTNHPDREWVEGEYNLAYKGERQDDLRDYILGKIAGLNVEQLLSLFAGSTYGEAVGVA